jgi:hypothetical protein
LTSIAPWKKNAGFILKLLILADFVGLFFVFLRTQFQVDIFPILGNRLNTLLALVLVKTFILGRVLPDWGDLWMARLDNWVSTVPKRYYLLAGLFGTEVFLEIMWFLYPEDFLWNLNAEKGYGTHFSTIQLYVVGLTVLLCARLEGKEAEFKEKAPWYLLASMYFFIGIDDCIGIHENFIKWSQSIALNADTFHFVHEWLWFYGPFIFAMVVFLIWFFLKRFKETPGALIVNFIALTLWIGVLTLEGLAKNIVDPTGLDESRILIGMEEGFEMLGATLFLFGYGQYLIHARKKKQ